MIYLTNNNEKLTKGIKDLTTIQLEQLKVKNKTLGGGYHVQTVGSPLKFIECTVLANETNVNLLNEAEADGTHLTLVVDSNQYEVMIDEAPSWRRLTQRYKNSEDTFYTSKLKLYIKEE